jgi:hypothetical protein
MLIPPDSARPLTTLHILHAAFPALNLASNSLAAAERSVHVVPQGAEPRWIILGDPRLALPVLRSWLPWNLGSRLRWSAVLLAASIKMLPQLPGVQNSDVRIGDSYWRHSLPEFSENWSAVVHVGNPSHTRKAIVFFVGERQRVKAVAKVPLTPLAAKSILNEAAMLLRMKTVEYLPRVLFQDADRGITVQSWLDGKPVSRCFTQAHLDLLSRLANLDSTVRVCDSRERIAAQLDALDLPFDRALLATALESLDLDEPLQGFVEHRDFVPWNLKWLPDGRLGLLDWEWSVANSLPWQDICRFFYLNDALFRGSGRVWEAMTGNRLLQKYLRQFSIPTSALPALTMHYLLRVLCMDCESGNVWLARYTFRQIELLLDIRRRTAAKR